MLPIQCANCAHYRKQNKCKAFPAGIPAEVLTGRHDHTEPFPGDKGIRFEPFRVTLDEKKK